MTLYQRVVIFVGYLVLGGLILKMSSDITGLTTRVNLLEARIHWQEAPPK